MLAIIGLTLLFMAIYFTAVSLPYELRYVSYGIMVLYMAALAVFAIVYICYNFAFTRKGITAEMLPDTWSDEEKDRFIQNGKDRLRKSRWMLLLILPILFTFAIDYVEFFFVPMIRGWFA